MKASQLDLSPFPTQVLDYLEKYPHLYALLDDAFEKIAYYFGEGTRVEAQLVPKDQSNDPEMQLFLNMVVLMDETEAFKKLHAFDVGWWLDNSGRAEGCLEFDVEFGAAASGAV